MKKHTKFMYLPIAMLVVKYKSPIGRTQEENNPMKIQKCGTGAKETALQIGRASTVRRASIYKYIYIYE